MLGTDDGTPVEIWFRDGAKVGQKGGHAYIWAKIGSRPLMGRDNRHDNAYLLGAICPARGVGAALITPAANTECMNRHLTEISTQVRPAPAPWSFAMGPVGISAAEHWNCLTTSSCSTCRHTHPS